MSLSEEERQVWDELERVLADNVSYTRTDAILLPQDSSGGFLRPKFQRMTLLIVALMIGLWFLLVGTFAHLLWTAIIGLIVICVAVHRLQRIASERADRVEGDEFDH